MSDNLIGKTIGGYEILNQVGQGGMATVYRAQQISMNRVVAIKVLPRHFMNDDTYLQRFTQEVKIVSQLEHRNIVPVYDYGESEGQPYIVMRYMPAGSVDDLIQKGALDIETALSIIEQIAPALDYAHSKNVLHRDLKPSNVLMDDNDGAFITDFGIARIVGEQGPGITTQGVVGTPSYMSPEQAQAHSLDGRSDIYSLGVMLFEMMTGRRPFDGDTPYSIAVMQVTMPAPSPRKFNPDVTPRVEQVIYRALKKDPNERYATAHELADDLHEAVHSPEKIHDTHPRPVFVAPVPQPIAPQQPMPSQQIPSQAMQPQVYMPSYTPMTPGGNRPITNSQVDPNWQNRGRKRRRGNVWFSIAFGALIGCALLTIMVVITAIVVNSLAGNNTPPVITVQSDDGSINIIGAGTERIPLDGTSESARQTLVPNEASEVPAIVTATEGIAPVGQRPTATFSPLLDNATGSILYFGPDEDSYEIFLMDVKSRIHTKLTEDTDVAANTYPSISEDGERVVFQSDRDGDFEIYSTNRVGGTLRQLTNNEVLDRLPAWSPDNEWVIYSSDVREDGNYDLYRVPAIGGDPELVFTNGQRNSHARYSPDGRYIVFTSGQSRNGSTWEILIMNVETGDVTQLTDNSVRDASPVFRPDGQYILYSTYGEGFAAIGRMDLDGGNKTILYDSPGYEWEASYSPDGNYIVFNNDITGRDEIYIMTADGIEAQLITDTGGAFPSWTR